MTRLPSASAVQIQGWWDEYMAAQASLDANRRLLLELRAVHAVQSELNRYALADLDQLDPWLRVLPGLQTVGELRTTLKRLGQEDVWTKQHAAAVMEHPQLIEAERRAEEALAAGLARMEQGYGRDHVDLAAAHIDGIDTAEVELLLNLHARAQARKANFDPARFGPRPTGGGN